MGIIDQKSKIFGNIAAARTVAEGLPKLITNPSFPSINNSGNSIEFLTDLLKSLVGMEKLREVIINTLAYKLDEMEITIKTAIKLSLKELVNCGVDPSIPSYIKSGGSGIKIETSKIDFFDILKTNPNSQEGRLLYSDSQANPLTSSNDFNTFLYGTIQNDGTTETWGTSPILDIKFDSVNSSPIPNNTLTFNANSAYNTKTLTDLNNNYVDSVDLFDSAGLLNKILDDIFGSTSLGLNKTTKQLQKEEEIKTIIENIANADDNDVIGDNFFTFSNEEVAAIEDAATWRKKGISICQTCGLKATSLPISTISAINTQISGTTGEAKKDAIATGINTLGQTIKGQATDNKDGYALELNFIEKIISGLVSSIVGFILSPKIIAIFLINYKIIYGPTAEYTDAVDFIKQNKNLIKNITKSIRNSIISVLLNSVLKEISSLVAETAIEIATEKAKNQLSQILSLVGIPQPVIRLIKGI
jgi:hypothetical protein